MKLVLILIGYLLFSSIAQRLTPHASLNGLDPHATINGVDPHSIDETIPNGILVNSLSQNGITLNGITLNGLTQNGIFPNGIFPNGITPNGITPNGIEPNGWTPNGLVGNGIVINGLTANGADVTLSGFTLSAIDLIRESNPENTLDELIPYLVHCALPPWKSWTGTVNGEETEIWGELGLAADLDVIPMLPTQQQLVSACLLSLVNYFGEHIELSSRNYPSSAAVKDEMKDYRMFEGAFFGDIFSGDYKKFACQGTRTAVALAQSPDREWRRCTDPGYNCEMEVLGECSQVCSGFTEDYGYSQCSGSDGLNYPAINVFLSSKRNH